MDIKKLFLTTCVATSLVGLTACTNASAPTTTDTPTETTPTTTPSAKSEMVDLSLFGVEDVENTHIYNATAEDIINALNSDDATMLVYIGSPGCSHCRNAIPSIHENAVKYDIPVYHVDIAELDVNEYAKLLEAIDPITMTVEETGEKDFFIPHVFSIVNGKLDTELSEIGFNEHTSYDKVFEAVKGGRK